MLQSLRSSKTPSRLGRRRRTRARELASLHAGRLSSPRDGEIQVAFVASQTGKAMHESGQLDRMPRPPRVDDGGVPFAGAIEQPTAVPGKTGTALADRKADAFAVDRLRSAVARPQQVDGFGAVRAVGGVAARGRERDRAPGGCSGELARDAVRSSVAAWEP